MCRPRPWPYGRGVQPLWTRRAPAWVDTVVGVLAAAAALTSLLSTTPAEIDPRLHPPTAWVAAVTVAGALGLVWRRRRPVLCFLLLLTAAVLVSASGHFIGMLALLLGIGLLSLAIHCRRRWHALAALAATLVALAGLALAGVPDLRPAALGQNGVLFLAVWAVGDALRSRRAHQAELVRSAEAEAAAARRDATAAATEERLRLAREMHDVVAHSMSLISVQAGVGAHVLRTDPEAAARALEIVADTSRQALAQTRALLAALREPGDAPARSPAPGVADLPELVERVRQSGLAVDVAVAGEARPLTGPVGLAAYRIVQEALTNVLKHAGAAHVTVGLTYGPKAVRIEVTDDGRGPGGPAGGHGLAGLRERAQLLGGSCAAGPGPAGGYTVQAELPA